MSNESTRTLIQLDVNIFAINWNHKTFNVGFKDAKTMGKVFPQSHSKDVKQKNQIDKLFSDVP